MRWAGIYREGGTHYAVRVYGDCSDTADLGARALGDGHDRTCPREGDAAQRPAIRVKLHVCEAGSARSLKPHAVGCRSGAPQGWWRTKSRWREGCGAGERFECHAWLAQHPEILRQQLAPGDAVEGHFHIASRILRPLEVTVSVHDDELVVDIGPRQHLLAVRTVVDVHRAVSVDLGHVTRVAVHDHRNCNARVDGRWDRAGDLPFLEVENNEPWGERHGHEGQIALTRHAHDRWIAERGSKFGSHISERHLLEGIALRPRSGAIHLASGGEEVGEARVRAWARIEKREAKAIAVAAGCNRLRQPIIVVPSLPAPEVAARKRQVEGNRLVVVLGQLGRRTLGGIEKGGRAIAAVLNASIEGEERDLGIVEPFELVADGLQFGIALAGPPIGERLMGQMVELGAEHVRPGEVLARRAQSGLEPSRPG